MAAPSEIAETAREAWAELDAMNNARDAHRRAIRRLRDMGVPIDTGDVLELRHVATWADEGCPSSEGVAA